MRVEAYTAQLRQQRSQHATCSNFDRSGRGNLLSARQLHLHCASTMEAAHAAPLRRLRRKTSLGFVAIAAAASAVAWPTPAEEDWSDVFLTAEELGQEGKGQMKSIYLVTLPALQLAFASAVPRPYLTCPSTWKHEQVAHALLHAFRNPVHACCRGVEHVGPVVLESFVVFREHHAPAVGQATGLVHWHIALRAKSSFRFAPYKRALQVHHGLASHWSTSHMGYWSAVRYGVIPSPKKPQEALDPEPWTWSRVGRHAPLFEVCQQPNTAAAMQQRREAKVKTAAAKAEKEPRPTEMDLYPIIVQHSFKNSADDQTADKQLIQWVKKHGSPALAAFAFKIRSKLASLIDDVWSWESVDDALVLMKQTRLQRLIGASREQCCCGGQWRRLAEHSMQANGISPRMLCGDVLASLREGRRPDLPTVVLMGRYGGEGKSFFFAPLKNIFGSDHVQMTPQPGSFPLLGLETKKVVLLDEWCFDSSVIPITTQLLWLEGKPFPVSRPQNKDYDGHLLYRGTAPIYVTCKERDLGPIIARAAQAMAAGKPSQDTMLLRRLRVYTLCQRLPVQPGENVPECPVCLANMLLQHGSHGVVDS